MANSSFVNFLSHKKDGSGIFNDVLNKLSVELHYPGYNYLSMIVSSSYIFCQKKETKCFESTIYFSTGPGTKLKERLKRGDKGINPLDEAAKEHNLSYDSF